LATRPPLFHNYGSLLLQVPRYFCIGAFFSLALHFPQGRYDTRKPGPQTLMTSRSCDSCSHFSFTGRGLFSIRLGFVFLSRQKFYKIHLSTRDNLSSFSHATRGDRRVFFLPSRAGLTFALPTPPHKNPPFRRTPRRSTRCPRLPLVGYHSFRWDSRGRHFCHLLF